MAPLDKIAWNNMGTVYEKKGDLGRAKNCFENALNSDPHYKLAQRNLKETTAKISALNITAKSSVRKVKEEAELEEDLKSKPSLKNEEIIQYLKKLPLIYEEIDLNKISSKTGVKIGPLEEIIEDLIMKGEIRGRIKGESLIFESRQQVEKVEVKREYDYVGGLVRFKVVIRNNTSNFINNVDVQLRMPEHIRLIRIVPPQYRRANKVFIPNMQHGQSQSIDFYIEPLICGTIPIETLVVFQESSGKPHSIVREAKSVITKCPPIINSGEENIARVKNLLQTVLYARQFKSWHLKENPQRVFGILQEAIQSWAGRCVTEPLIQIVPSFRGDIYYYVLSKVADPALNNRQEQIVLHLKIDSDHNVAFITVACEKPATACGVLTHVWELCEKRIAEA